MGAGRIHINEFANPESITLPINGVAGTSKVALIFGSAGDSYNYLAIVGTSYDLTSAYITFIYKQDNSMNASLDISSDKSKINITFNKTIYGRSVAIWRY